MNTQTLILFTAKTIEQILEDGGSQSWALSRAHVKACEYAVLCRNRHTDWGTGREPHGSAFMVGHVRDVVRCSNPESPDRWLVRFDRYALVDKPDVWAGWRNPVRYLAEPPFALSGLDFMPMPASHLPEKVSTEPSAKARLLGLSMERAKIEVAAHYGVLPAAVEITIRG